MKQQPFKQIYYLAPDNTKLYFFEGKTRALQSWQNFGMPEINFIEDRGPNQHGTTVRDWRAQTRAITLEWFGQNCDGRQCEYATVIEKIRPTFDNSPGYLRIINQDTTLVEIPAWIRQGPGGNWSVDSGLRNLQVRDALQFHCADPIWREAVQQSVIAEIDIEDSCLEMCLPACLGTNLLSSEIDICYNGSWPGDQITITIQGPLDAPTVTNETTGEVIQLNYNIAFDETVTIIILPESATVESSTNGNIIGTVTNVSDLVFFKLAPRQVNIITFGGANATEGVSSIALDYYVRYLSAYDSCFRLPCLEPSYAEALEETYGATEVWPLVDIEGGVFIPAFVDKSRNGLFAGWQPQNLAGPVQGSLAPLSDGINNYGNIFSSNGVDGLVDIFDGDVGSLFIWARKQAWGAAVKYWFRLVADNDNQIEILNSGATNIVVRRRGSAIIDSVTFASGAPTTWHSIGLSWDTGADELKVFFGTIGSPIEQKGTTQTGLGAWSGDLTEAVVGASSAVGSNSFDGWLAYYAVKIGSIWTPTDFNNMHNAALTASAD